MFGNVPISEEQYMKEYKRNPRIVGIALIAKTMMDYELLLMNPIVEGMLIAAGNEMEKYTATQAIIHGLRMLGCSEEELKRGVDFMQKVVRDK